MFCTSYLIKHLISIKSLNTYFYYQRKIKTLLYKILILVYFRRIADSKLWKLLFWVSHRNHHSQNKSILISNFARMLSKCIWKTYIQEKITVSFLKQLEIDSSNKQQKQTILGINSHMYFEGKNQINKQKSSWIINTDNCILFEILKLANAFICNSSAYNLHTGSHTFVNFNKITRL